MRKRDIAKVKAKKINDCYSDFELKEFLEEIKEYTNLIKSVGFKVKKKDIKQDKKIFVDNDIKSE